MCILSVSGYRCPIKACNHQSRNRSNISGESVEQVREFSYPGVPFSSSLDGPKDLKSNSLANAMAKRFDIPFDTER